MNAILERTKVEPSRADGRVRKVGNLHVIRVSGTPYEMGFQHGRLLRDVIPQGPIPYFRGYCEKILRRAGLGRLAPLAMRAIHETVGRSVVRAFPPFVRDTVSGLAEGAGLSQKEAYEAFAMPDTLLWIAARLMRLAGVKPAERHRMAQALGCSSAMAWGAATTDGKLYHARNLDYHGVEAWTRSAAVIFHAPEDGQRYASIAAAGVPMGGTTAMNESGLTLTVHQHMFSDATRLGGTPIGVAGDVVMREARTLDDAERILSTFTPIGCWTYLVADGKTNEVLCFEESPARRSARRIPASAQTFRYANVYLDGPLSTTEMDLYGSYWRANWGRYQALEERLAAGRGALGADGMAAILGDTCEERDGCRLRRAVAMLMTVGSVVFSPSDGRFWVASGAAPTSHTPFEPFDLASEGHAPAHGRLTSGVPADAATREAFESYRDAYVAYFDRDDVPSARALVGRAVERAPREPLYRVVQALLALLGGDASAAAAALSEALRQGHKDPERAAEMHLWRGRAHDLLGDRPLALADYDAVLALGDRADPPVREAARRNRSRPYTSRQARGIAVDFAFADVVRP